MSAIPGNIGRVPTLLASQLSLRNITSTNVGLLNVQEQLSTGLRVNRVSDDPTGAALIRLLDDRLARAEQRGRNLQHASSLLNTSDQLLGESVSMVQEAKSIASSQIGIGSDEKTRELQAGVISSLRNELLVAMNGDYLNTSLFAGSKAGVAAFEEFNGGIRYNGDDGGFTTDLGPELDFPLTLTGDQAVGATSARVKGDRDLNPVLTTNTLLKDLSGPMEGKGVGSLTVNVDDGTTVTPIQIDLSDADSIGDVVDTLSAEISDKAPVDPLGPGGVSFTNDRLSVDVAAGFTVTFEDGDSGSTAQALGIDGFDYMNGSQTKTLPSADLDPKVTEHTPLGALNPATAVTYGDIRFTNGNKSGTVTTDPAMTVGQFAQEVEKLDLGIGVQIAESGDAIDVVNTVSGIGMSIEEVGGGTAATTLGIRSLKATTELDSFNMGKGVEIAHGNTDESGNPDPAQNTDFEVTLADGTTTFTVDLVPADMTDVGTLLAKIESEASAQGVPVGPGGFQAGLAGDGNGIVLRDNIGGANPVSVTSLNGWAAEDLGLLDGTASAGPPATLVGEDRATVEVDSVFSTMIHLEQALQGNDVRGIEFAAGRLEDDLDRATTARALAGTRAARVGSLSDRVEERSLVDEQVRSEIRDLDFAEAASRFSLLQTQLQGAYAAVSQTQSLSLLNFLG